MSKYQVPAVVGAVKILNELGGLGDAGATQSQLVGTTGLSKSTLHNLLSTLESSGFVRKDPDSRIYHRGPALIPLGSAASRQIKLVRSAMDRLEPLATREHLSFAVAQRIDQDQAQIIERFYPSRDVHVGITVGSSYGPMDGALGKVLLAGMDRERAKKLIKGRKLPAHTPSTITSPESLLEDVEGVSRRGWAASKGELNENNAVAAPVWGPSGEIELIVLALGFASTFSDERIPELGDLLRQVADEVMTDAGVPVRNA